MLCGLKWIKWSSIYSTYTEGKFEDEGPQTEICFEELFWIDRYEVTNAQYRKCVEDGKCTLPSEGLACSPYGDIEYDNYPVECVDWFQANDYAAWRGSEYKLPSEAQWEYAARGPDNLIYPWGNTPVVDNVVGGHPAEVGSKPSGASWVGAYDLSGNVWEWTSTIRQSYPYDANDGRENNDNTDSSRVFRGGSWNYHMRAAYRLALPPVIGSGDTGFRLIFSPPSR